MDIGKVEAYRDMREKSLLVALGDAEKEGDDVYIEMYVTPIKYFFPVPLCTIVEWHNGELQFYTKEELSANDFYSLLEGFDEVYT